MKITLRRLFTLSLACMLMAAATATAFRILLNRQEAKEYAFEQPGPVAAAPAGSAPAPVASTMDSMRITGDNVHAALYEMAGTYLPEVHFSNDVGLQPIVVYFSFSRERTHFEGNVFARQCVLDPFESAWKRSDALRYVNDSGPSSMDLQVIRAAVRLLETSADPEVRADLCWGLVAVPEPEAVESLLRRLESDIDERVRLEAVNALGPSQGSSERIQGALKHAAYHDSSRVVRERAADLTGVAEEMIEER